MPQFIESVDGTLINVEHITSIEPFHGGWGQVVHLVGGHWRWVHPDVIANNFNQGNGVV